MPGKSGDMEYLTSNIQTKDDFMNDLKVQLGDPKDIRNEMPDPQVLVFQEKVTLAEFLRNFRKTKTTVATDAGRGRRETNLAH